MRLSEIVERAKRWTDDERATSPTIGSVLLVGITVVLASTVGAQMYSVTDTQQRPFAVAPVEYDAADDSVTVTWMANTNAEEVQVTVHAGGERRAVVLSDIGDTVTVDPSGVTLRKGAVTHWDTPAVEDGEEVSVVVTATTNGNTVVLSEHAETV